jgi:hypothetical protein
MTPEVQAQVFEAVAAWLNYEFDAQEFTGFPLKEAPPVFRPSLTAPEWESSWGYNVPYSDVNHAECQAVLNGTLPSTLIGEYAFARRPDGMYDLGCFVLDQAACQTLLDQTP